MLQTASKIKKATETTSSIVLTWFSFAFLSKTDEGGSQIEKETHISNAFGAEKDWAAKM